MDFPSTQLNTDFRLFLKETILFYLFMPFEIQAVHYPFKWFWNLSDLSLSAYPIEPFSLILFSTFLL